MLLYDEWNEVKKECEKDQKDRFFKEREIFFIKMGQNIGFEQNGKGVNFTRPIVIMKRISKDMFLGIPLSTTIREGSFFHTFEFDALHKGKIQNSAILIQIKLFSSKRLLNKIGTMSKGDFEIMKNKIKDYIG